MNCFECIWAEKDYPRQKIKCVKKVFAETSLIGFNPLRKACRYFETFRQAVNRVTTEQERRRAA